MYLRASGDANTPEAFLRRFLREQQMLLSYRQLSLPERRVFFSLLKPTRSSFSSFATNGLHMRGEKSETTSARRSVRAPVRNVNQVQVGFIGNEFIQEQMIFSKLTFVRDY